MSNTVNIGSQETTRARPLEPVSALLCDAFMFWEMFPHFLYALERIIYIVKQQTLILIFLFSSKKKTLILISQTFICYQNMSEYASLV